MSQKNRPFGTFGKEGTRENRTELKTYVAVLYLVACALNEVPPDPKFYEDADPESVLTCAGKHSVISMAAYALEKAGYEGIPDGLEKKFRDARFKAVRKNILLDTERKSILSHLEDEGIRYMPLKGTILQSIYPEPGMRQMSDNDILIDCKAEERVKAFMLSRGFRCKNGPVHDCYYKEPVYNYEMHKQLFPSVTGDGIYEGYYKDIWNKALVCEGLRYGYRLRDEDFYIYITAHAHKHYDGSGTGIRTLADHYVINRAYAGLDRDYIENELDKLKLTGFESCIRTLSDKLFSMPGDMQAVIAGLPSAQLHMLERILSSGAYGTEENNIISRMKKRGIEGEISGRKRFIYLFKRLFPDRKTLMPLYPLAKYRLLIPAVWVFRIVRGVLTKSGKIIREIRIVRDQDKIY